MCTIHYIKLVLTLNFSRDKNKDKREILFPCKF